MDGECSLVLLVFRSQSPVIWLSWKADGRLPGGGAGGAQELERVKWLERQREISGPICHNSLLAGSGTDLGWEHH